MYNRSYNMKIQKERSNFESRLLRMYGIESKDIVNKVLDTKYKQGPEDK